jgi:hypothetical protein
MDTYEETRPSFHLNSFSSTAFKSSVVEHFLEDPKKHFRKHLKFQTPLKDLLTSRTMLTPRTQMSSLSNTNDKEINLNENFRFKDENLDSGTELLTLDEDCKDFPTLKWCAFCKREVMTEVFYKNSSKTFWAALGIFLTGGVCGCFMLPYVTGACQDVAMKCSKCGREV